MRIKHLFVAVCCTLTMSTALGQENDLGKLLLKGCPGNYMGQYADNSNDKDGMGIKGVSGGGVYIGDINRDKYNGKGMLICGDKGTISNCPDAYAYVGGWIKGKKEGNGICYAPNGDIIYQGKFKNDKPVDVYPTQNPDMEKYFSMMETQTGYYIGEIKEGAENGFGLCIQKDGAYWVGSSRDGQRAGMSIFLYGPNEWRIVKYKDGVYSDILSSADYNSRNSIIKKRNNEVWSEFWTGMNDVAENLMQIGMQYAQSKNAGNNDSAGQASESGYAGGMSGNANGKSGGATKANSSKKGNDCGTSWMTESRVYSNYETQLIKGGQSAEDREEIRRKMRNIRQKWEKRGCTITKSPQE